MRTYLIIALFSMTAASSISGQTIDSTQMAFIHLYRGGNENDLSYKLYINDAEEDIIIKASEKHKVTAPAGPTKISVYQGNFSNGRSSKDLNFKAEAGKSYYFKIQRRTSDLNIDDFLANFTFDIVQVTERMFLKETNQNSR